MQLFLSGAEVFGATQKDFEKSLGGFMSSTPLPNGRMNALFTDIAQRALYSQLPFEETIAIFLYNNSGSDKTNVSLSQIYSNLFTEDDNFADFQWAAVTAIDNQRIEKISSKKESPFYAEFVTPTARRADGILKILTPGVAGQTIKILTVTITLSGNTIASLLNDVKLAFNSNLTYNCSIKDDSTLYFQYKTVGPHVNGIILVTTGSATATPSNFSNGFNNGVVLVASLKKDEVLGLWIKRTIKPAVKKTCSELAGGGDTSIVDGDGVITDIPLPIPKNLENLEVIFDWN